MMNSASLNIAIQSPRRVAGRDMIARSTRALAEHYSEDECFSLTVDELAAPNVEFLLACENGEPVGCVALVDQMSYGEIKRLFVRRAARGRGIGAALMAAAERAAAEIGLRSIRLETGERLASAVKLYEGMGYRPRGAFGAYAENEVSLFMEKSI